MRTICEPCAQGNCAQCEPVADPEREMVFTDCDHLCDPVVTTRDAQVTALIVAAQIAFGRGDDEATKTALRRCLAVMDPPRAEEKPAAAKPLRRFALVQTSGKPSTADCYAQASGEPIPEWMQVKHDGEKR